MMQEKVAVTVAENGLGRYQQSIRAGAHTLIADEPRSMGGNDAGPAPYQLLLAALGACTSMTLRMYAERKGWPLGAVSVSLEIEKLTGEQGAYDSVSRRIELRGELSDEQRQRLLEIANRCPVHRSLAGNMVITSELL